MTAPPTARLEFDYEPLNDMLRVTLAQGDIVILHCH
jgi:hypothetical protein